MTLLPPARRLVVLALLLLCAACRAQPAPPAPTLDAASAATLALPPATPTLEGAPQQQTSPPVLPGGPSPTPRPRVAVARTGTFQWAVVRQQTAPGGLTTAIVLQDDEADAPQAVTTDIGLHASPAWASDGNQLLYSLGSVGARQIVVVDVASSQVPRNLSSNSHDEHSPTWSPDRAQLAYVSHRDGPAHIYTMTPDGRGVQALTTGSSNHIDPAWSPDGTQIAFTSDRGGQPDLYVMDRDGSNILRLTSDSATERSPAWAPNGTLIVFTSNNTGAPELYMLALPGALNPPPAPTPRPTLDPAELPLVARRLTFDGAAKASPSWSPDGTQIAYVVDVGGVGQVALIDPGGDDQALVTNSLAPILAVAWRPPATR